MTQQIIDQSKTEAFKNRVWFKSQFLVKQYGAFNRAAQKHLCACPICQARHISDQADKMNGVTRNDAGNVPVRGVSVDVVEIASVPDNRLELDKGVTAEPTGWPVQYDQFWVNLARPFPYFFAGGYGA